MIMSDTCATHRSQVSGMSSGKDKRRSDDSARPERTRTFVVLFIVFYASVERERQLLYFRLSLFYYKII